MESTLLIPLRETTVHWTFQLVCECFYVNQYGNVTVYQNLDEVCQRTVPVVEGAERNIKYKKAYTVYGSNVKLVFNKALKDLSADEDEDPYMVKKALFARLVKVVCEDGKYRVGEGDEIKLEIERIGQFWIRAISQKRLSKDLKDLSLMNTLGLTKSFDSFKKKSKNDDAIVLSDRKVTKPVTKEPGVLPPHLIGMPSILLEIDDDNLSEECEGIVILGSNPEAEKVGGLQHQLSLADKMYKVEKQRKEDLLNDSMPLLGKPKKMEKTISDPKGYRNGSPRYGTPRSQEEEKRDLASPSKSRVFGAFSEHFKSPRSARTNTHESTKSPREKKEKRKLFGSFKRTQTEGSIIYKKGDV